MTSTYPSNLHCMYTSVMRNIKYSSSHNRFSYGPWSAWTSHYVASVVFDEGSVYLPTLARICFGDGSILLSPVAQESKDALRATQTELQEYCAERKIMCTTPHFTYWDRTRINAEYGASDYIKRRILGEFL